jgi:hypothetical protein
MDTIPAPLLTPPRRHRHFELRFRSLFDAGKALVFPCDAQGRVQMDQLSERALDNYLFARAVVGRDYAVPELRELDD